MLPRRLLRKTPVDGSADRRRYAVVTDLTTLGEKLRGLFDRLSNARILRIAAIAEPALRRLLRERGVFQARQRVLRRGDRCFELLSNQIRRLFRIGTIFVHFLLMHSEKMC